jgi:hypothetical protein
MPRRMSKHRISNPDLCWLISEEFDRGKEQTRTAFAVVPDGNDGWRVVISSRARKFLTAADERRLADIQRRLRLVYDLRP